MDGPDERRGEGDDAFEPSWPDREDVGDQAAFGVSDEELAQIQAALDGWDDGERQERPLPSRLSTWRRTSLMGAVAAGIGLGLQEVFDPPKDEPIVIEVDADGEPHDLPIRLLLDPDDPAGSLCIVRRDPPPPVV